MVISNNAPVLRRSQLQITNYGCCVAISLARRVPYNRRTMYAILFLVISNVFMTMAWYGHLKWFKDLPMWQVILASWLIAFAEYCFQVPANRIGFTREHYSVAQLKTIQEVITLIVFTFFSLWYLKEEFKWNYAVGFLLMVAAVFVIFKKW